MAFVQEAEKLIKSTAHRMVLCRASKVPFPYNRSCITIVVQYLSHRFLIDGQSITRIIIFGPDRIVFITKPGLIFSCHDPSPGRTAVWSANIPRCKPDSIFRNGVDIRRRNLWISLTPQLSVTQIIGYDQQDIRSC